MTALSLPSVSSVRHFPHSSGSHRYLCGLKALPLNLPMEPLKLFSLKSFPSQLSIVLKKNKSCILPCVFVLAALR